jgi:hypothetical protein
MCVFEMDLGCGKMSLRLGLVLIKIEDFVLMNNGFLLFLLPCLSINWNEKSVKKIILLSKTYEKLK